MMIHNLDRIGKGQFADLGNDVWLGNFDACNRYLKDFDLAIHVWHPDQPGFCNHLLRSESQKQSGGLKILYKEASPLSKDTLAAVYKYAKTDGKLFVHCSAGLSRSATFAIVCKAARGCDPFKALEEISRAMWTQYEAKHSPQFHCKNLNEVFRWLEENV